MRSKNVFADGLSLIQWGSYLAMAVLIYVFCLLSIHPEFMHHVQQVGFYLNPQFSHDFIYNPGGLSRYVALYITQYFYHPAYAALGIGALLTLQAIIIRQILRKITDNRYVVFVISFLPALLLLPLLQDYCFPYAVIISHLFVTICLWMVALLMNSLIVLPLVIVLGIGIFHTADSGPFVLFTITSLVLLLFRKNRKRSLIEAPVLILFGIFLPVFFAHYVYNLPIEERYTRFFEPVPVLILYKPVKLFYVAVWSLPVFLLLARALHIAMRATGLNPKWISVRIVRMMIAPASWLLLMAGAFFLVQYHNDKSSKLMSRIDYETYANQCESAVRNCKQFGGFNIFVNFNYNLACMKLDQLVERFFEYPQLLGDQAMFPDKISTGQIAMNCSDFYYQLGYISESRHWAYEAQTLLPYSPRVLKQLARVNIIMKDYDAAMDYLRILMSSPVEKKWAGKYLALAEDTTLANLDPEIAEKRKQMPINKVIHLNMDEIYEQLLQKDHTNHLAYQCMQLYDMLGQRMGRVVKNYQDYGKFFSQKSPEIIGEACLLYLIKTNHKDMSGFPVSTRVQKNVAGFNQILNRYQGDFKQARKELESIYGNTYLFYLMYYSPLVTHATVSTREVEY
jgi:hypothetical protein